MGSFRITAAVRQKMIASCLDAYPYEGCGLLAGTEDGATMCLPVPNSAGSSRVYTIDPSDFLKADQLADAAGLVVDAVFHSHTHTAPFPSPTDVAQAPVPSWHYLLVSFRGPEPEICCYRIVDGQIESEDLIVTND